MPDPILMSIATTLTSKAAGSLYDLVRQKFAKRPAGSAVLEAAEGAPADSTEVRVLAEELGRAERSDPEFSTQLRDVWRHLTVDQRVDRSLHLNQITGTVEGNAVQARDINGGISF